MKNRKSLSKTIVFRAERGATVVARVTLKKQPSWEILGALPANACLTEADLVGMKRVAEELVASVTTVISK